MHSIDSAHRLRFKGKLVERIMSPYTGGKFSPPPSTTIMHFTYGASARSSANWFSAKNNKYKSSAHVVVGRSGEVIQCVDFDDRANHAGKSFWRGKAGLNQWSFGIELANWGYLRSGVNGWASYTGVSVPDPVLATHRNGNPPASGQGPIGWEPYPSVQIDTAAEIVRLLIEKYGDQEIIGHDDVSVGRKWDPGPAFDMEHFREIASGDQSVNTSGLLLVYTPSDTLNLREGPSIAHKVKKKLEHDTVLEPIQFDGIWAMVNELNEQGQATSTGWVNTRHTRYS